MLRRAVLKFCAVASAGGQLQSFFTDDKDWREHIE
jgi:hypothetical protein